MLCPSQPAKTVGLKMKRNKPQLHRLLALDRLIRDGKYPNALTFAREWEVSQKTIQRDIEFLRDMLGAPIKYDRAQNGYYYTDQQWDFLAPVRQVKSLIDEESLNRSLFEAAALGERTRLVELITLGDDVNWQDFKDERTPLMEAARSGRADVVKVLLKARARMDRKNVSGHSALTDGIKSEDPNLIRQLLTAAAKQGLTPDQIALHRALFELRRKIDRLKESLHELEAYPKCVGR
jgi:Ankyrin repeats (3 copies)